MYFSLPNPLLLGLVLEEELLVQVVLEQSHWLLLSQLLPLNALGTLASILFIIFMILGSLEVVFKAPYILIITRPMYTYILFTRQKNTILNNFCKTLASPTRLNDTVQTFMNNLN